MISSLPVTHPVNSSLSRREMLRAAATVLPVLTGFTRDVISAAAHFSAISNVAGGHANGGESCGTSFGYSPA